MTPTASQWALTLSGHLTGAQCAELVALLRQGGDLEELSGPLERRFGSVHWVREVVGLGCSAQDFAGLVELAAHARSAERKAQHVEFIWTGPRTSRVTVQTTEQTFLDLIDRAEKRLVLLTYAAREVDSVIEALERADRRGVASIVIFETQMRGQPFNAEVVRRLKKMPGLRPYGWPEREGGASLHAKLVVADGERALVTSANLTQAALRRNVEAGVLVEGGSIPQRVEAHVLELIANGDFVSV